MAEFIERTRTLPAMEGVTELVTAAKKKGLRLAIAPSALKQGSYTGNSGTLLRFILHSLTTI